jgi:protein gp37
VNQEEAERDIPKLRQVPARTRFLSVEPMLGPISLTRLSTDTSASECCGAQRFNALTGESICDLSDQVFDSDTSIDWVIDGDESGRGARPIHSIRNGRVRCAISAGVPACRSCSNNGANGCPPIRTTAIQASRVDTLRGAMAFRTLS